VYQAYISFQAKYLDKMNAAQAKQFADENNIPDVEGMIQKTRASGYNSRGTSILEFVDNSLDADATKINILLLKKRDTGKKDVLDKIIIMCNGRGMKLDEFTNSYRLGGLNKSRNNMKDNIERTIKKIIGKFGWGWKSAAFNLGSQVIMVTKPNNEEMYGVRFDVDHMIHNSTYNPQIKCVNKTTTCESLLPYFSPDIVAKFNDYEHGTMIMIDKLESKFVTSIEKAIKELKMHLYLSYSASDTHADIQFGTDLDSMTSVELFDITYRGDPDAIEHEICTTLHVYKEDDKYRVFEESTSKRPTDGGKEIGGSLAKPVYYTLKMKLKENNAGKKKKSRDVKEYTDNLPKKRHYVGSFTAHVVKITNDAYKRETELFGEIHPKRKGFVMKRDNRIIAIGKEFGIYMNMEAERVRAVITFSNDLDTEFGINYNKTISDTIPTKEIVDALYCIFSPCVNAWKDKKRGDTNSCGSQDEEAISDTETAPVNDHKKTKHQKKPAVTETEDEEAVAVEEAVVEEAVEEAAEEAATVEKEEVEAAEEEALEAAVVEAAVVEAPAEEAPAMEAPAVEAPAEEVVTAQQDTIIVYPIMEQVAKNIYIFRNRYKTTLTFPCTNPHHLTNFLNANKNILGEDGIWDALLQLHIIFTKKMQI